MSNYQTLNPVPSIDPRDLDDNATVFDKLMNAETPSEYDRLGKLRKTWFQMEQDASALVSPNVAALAAITAAADKGFFFSSPLAMSTFTYTLFSRSLGAAVDAPAFRTLIDALGTTGTAAEAVKLETSRSIAATGDISWTVTFDGSANATAVATLATISVDKGGTGSTTAASARTALGVAFTAWTNLTLANSWVAVAGRRAAFRSFLDMVQLEVNISTGTATDGTVLFTLPAGSRPALGLVVPVSSGINTPLASNVPPGRVLIGADGTVACFNCTNSPGIAFAINFATV